ncbi:hypothetical protein AXF13_00890 [Desulfovibrio fairfieldensis]|uniref:Uncharacterized protein n=1 Tax=Desulfovibrio fairfieldensis TaxID=44742 RepID=A0A120KLM8_9BACT|nr:hypothetical protein AXF13_00890 [Desulfovibrio fairfieldensis]
MVFLMFGNLPLPANGTDFHLNSSSCKRPLKINAYGFSKTQQGLSLNRFLSLKQLVQSRISPMQ